MPTAIVPAYGLYGERLAQRFPDALHVEPIAVRSAVHGWTIEPHLHRDLYQFFLLTGGGGDARIDGRAHALAPGTAILLPPTTIHEFRFLAGTDGYVASAPAGALRRLFEAEPESRALLAEPMPIAAAPAEVAHLAAALRLSLAEFATNLADRDFALGACADLVAAWFCRAVRRQTAGGAPTRDARAGLVGRFLERVEARFRAQEPLTAYARDLGVSVPHLSRTCRAVLGHSAARVIQDRLMLEARRDLVYTALSVSQISFRLGFSDPAYFSRFFAKRAGIPPSDYRATR